MRRKPPIDERQAEVAKVRAALRSVFGFDDIERTAAIVAQRLEHVRQMSKAEQGRAWVKVKPRSSR